MRKAIKSKSGKWLLLPALFLALILLSLHVVNAIRLESAVFDKAIQALVERSRRIEEQAGPGYQAEALAALSPNPNNGAFFRFDDRLGKASLRRAPSIPQDRDKSGVIFSFEFDDPGRPGLVPSLGLSKSQVRNGMLRIEHDDSDYVTNQISFQIPKDEIGEILIRARVSKGTQMVLAWSTKPPSESSHEELWWKKNTPRIDIDLIDNANFHTYAINAKTALERGLVTGDKVRRILLCPSNVDGAVVEIDFVRFLSKRAKYWMYPHGVDYESIGGETRHVLYMLPDQDLEYSLRIPERSPSLDFGNGVLVDGEAVDFEVYLFHDHRKVNLHTKRLTDASEWHDFRLDLSRWAGKRVKLSLRVSGSEDNVAFWSNPLLSSDPKQRLNVIVIVEDALRADHLSLHGYEVATSPVRDGLLTKRGIVFDNAISQATWTRASVPTLMTSLLPTATGVWHWSDILSDEYLTLAEIMRSQGYLTASFVQNENAGLSPGLHQGFSQVFGPGMLGGETEGIFGDRLAAWLEQHRHRNFFIYLHVRDPHGPYDPPAPFDHWYTEAPPGGTPVERRYLDPPGIESPTSEGRRLLYDGEIRHNDAQLASLLERLEALEFDANTVLVFTADHGEYLGERGLWDHRPPGYLQVIGVPLGIVYPARFDESKRILQTVQLIDVMPTILELAGIDTSNLLLQGDSLVDLMEGRRLSYWEDRVAASEEPYNMSKHKMCVCGSLFFRRWHLVSSRSSPLLGAWRVPATTLRMSVFDFRNDRDESRVILSFVPDLLVKYRFARAMKELQSNDMAAWKKWTAREQDEAVKLDPEVQKRLRALGYIN